MSKWIENEFILKMFLLSFKNVSSEMTNNIKKIILHLEKTGSESKAPADEMFVMFLRRFFDEHQ